MAIRRNWLVRFGAGVAVVVGLAGLALAAGLLYLQTDAGRRFAVEQVAAAVSTDDMTVVIGALDGSLLSSFTLRDIAVADRTGGIAFLDRVTVAWRPVQLLLGRVAIDGITATHIDLRRLPAAVAGEDDRRTPVVIPVLEFVLGRLAIDELLLGEEVAGVSARLTIAGSAALAADGRAASLRLDIRRTDATAGHASIELDYAAHPPRFAASAEIEEPPGGQIARLVGIPGEPAVSLRLDGAGPAEDWRGRLDLAAGEIGLTAGLAVSVADGQPSAAIRGRAQAGALMPDWLVPLVGSAVTFDASVRPHPPGGWVLERLEAESGVVQLDGAGRYDARAGTLVGDLALATRAPLAFPADPEPLRADQAQIAVRIDGPIARPGATVTMSALGLEAGGVGAGEASVRLRIATTQSGRFSIEGSATLSHLRTGSLIPTGLLGDELSVGFDATTNDSGAIDLSRFDLASGPLLASATGRYAPPGDISGAYRIALERIGALAEDAGLSPDGSIRFFGDVHVNAERLTGTATVGGTVDGMAPEGGPLVALLGQSVPVKATVERRADGTMRVIGLYIGLATATARGEATMTEADGRIRGHLELDLPALAPFSAVAGTELSGSGRLRAEIAGPPDRIAGGAVLSLDRPTAGGVAFDRIELRTDAKRDGNGGSGTVALSVTAAGMAVPGTLRFAVDGQTLRLTNIALGQDPNRITGALRIGLDDVLAEGTLSARLRELSALPWPVAADGEIDATIRLTRVDGQRVALDATGRRLRAPLTDDGDLAIGGTTVSAVVENALVAPRLNGTIEATDAVFGAASLSRIALDIRAADMNAVAFDGSAEGRYGAPLSLSFAGRASIEDGTYRATLTRLSGRLAGTGIDTSEPFHLIWRDSRHWSVRSTLKAGDGTISGAATRGPDRIDAALSIETLPLALATLVAPGTDLDGTLSGQATLVGSSDGPTGRVAIDVRALRPRNAGWPVDDGFAVTANLVLAENRLTVSGAVRGPKGTAVDLRAGARARLSLGDDGPAFSADGPLDGSVTIGAQIGLLDRLIGLGENRLDGQLAGEVRLGGTIANPQANGTVTLAGGRFESIEAGTVLRDMTATIELDGSRLRLAAFEARDGGAGRIRGGGTMGLGSSAGWPLEIDLAVAQFAALARDDATVRVSGDIRLRGGAASPRIEAVLEVDGGDIRIPDRLGGGAAALDVIEVNTPADSARPVQAPEQRTVRSVVAIPLDIGITVPGRVFVRGRGLDSEWKGRLDIKGTTAVPRIVGGLAVVRGNFAFAGRNFVLREGRVRFDGADAVDPALAVRAVAAIQNVNAALVVSGTASTPRIALESDPMLPSDEILSRILFGKSFGQLNAVQAAQLAQSAAELSGTTSGSGVLDRVRRGLGVDVLSVGAQGDSVQGASLQAGKYITDEVFVSVDQGTKTGSQKVGVEIQLTPNITVETDVGPDAGSSVGINWKWDY